MTQIDFYVLEEGSRANRFTLTCRLCEKIYHQGRRILIHTESEEETRHMERLLWTFRQGSFVPHGIAERCDHSVTPVIISHQQEAGEEQDVLINLGREVPNFFSRFQRVAEIIDQEPPVVSAGRERFKFYRDRGYPLNKHDIR
ncbi:MAG: DNA polymerase III subunit chi [Candidatus Thiodiazotropha taylori]|nr:DNA polymerase III subunit chi [Candidatus Thiodiazotropha endolucinida]MCG8049937.1 DNA polymerase III subunit chi [Candidatus Thiodiazotropha taylori]MCW4229567.1 DNA polymerase III subunit chi [Candidatus Thiodiazotropha taylori]MCW4311754.1 DNA polymerase III subunit chi [Candidatus Thiodiazotropha taylori]